MFLDFFVYLSMCISTILLDLYFTQKLMELNISTRTQVNLQRGGTLGLN